MPIVDDVCVYIYIFMFTIIYLFYICIGIISIDLLYVFRVVEKGRDSILCTITLQSITMIIDYYNMYTCFLYATGIRACLRGQTD